MRASEPIDRVKIARRIADCYWYRWSRSNVSVDYDELVNVAYVGIRESENCWSPNCGIAFDKACHRYGARAVLAYCIALCSPVRRRKHLGDSVARAKQMEVGREDLEAVAIMGIDLQEQRRSVLLDGIVSGVRIRLDRMAKGQKQRDVVEAILNERTPECGTKEYAAIKQRTYYFMNILRNDRAMQALAETADWVDML